RASHKPNLTKLVPFGSRHSTGAGHAAAAAFARAQLDAMGYQTQQQTVAVTAGQTQNVIADKPGSGSAPRRLTIVTAHLDSINLAGGPSAPAPGADDNGRGRAGGARDCGGFGGAHGPHDF